MVETPTLIYDGDCRLCGRAARWLELRSGGRVDICRFQDFPFEGSEGFGPEDCTKAVHWIEPSGRWARATEACARAFAHAPAGGWAKLFALPGLRQFGDLFYYRVAKNRTAVGKAWRLLSGPDGNPPSFGTPQRMFLLLLGMALLSFFVDAIRHESVFADEGGIAPFALAAEGAGGGWGAFFESPSLFRVLSFDTASLLVTVLGLFSAISLFVGFFPLLGVACGLVAVLSFTSMAFPPFPADPSRATLLYGVSYGDRLLVQCLIAALFIAPWTLRHRFQSHGSGMVGRIALRLLLLRLCWFGPLTELVAIEGFTARFDAAKVALWASGSASSVGLWVATSWVADLVIGLWTVCGYLVPVLILGPRRVRHVGSALLALTGISMFVVGQGPLGFLVLALGLSQTDDRMMRWGSHEPVPRAQAGLSSRIAALALVVITTLQGLAMIQGPVTTREGFLSETRLALRPTGLLEPLPAWQRPRSVRPVLVFSTSADLETWTEWTTKVLPGDPMRAAPKVSRHAHRLDHMLGLLADEWAVAAALGAQPSNRGFRSFNSFGRGWLDGSLPITAYLEPVDELDGPPKYLRAQLYAYEPTSAEERQRTGRRWLRTRVEYGGVWGLKDGDLWRVVR